MRRTSQCVGSLQSMILLLAFGAGSCASSDYRELSIERLRDKIRGGWAGQMIGVSYGAPTEFRFAGQIIPRNRLPEWSEDRLANALRQDDLYVEMTFARVLDEKGLDATTEDFAAMFRDSRYRLWHANLAARRALRRGISGPESGTPRYNVHANDIDFQIESDFIGLMAPGLPRAAGDLCQRVGRIMNSGDGILGGIFVATMYSAAFFEDDPRRIVEAGLRSLPARSLYARTIRDVLDWSEAAPDDWTAVWSRLEEKWSGREVCPAGVLLDFNIDARLNGAYVALGLLYGHGDVEKTLEVATRAGQDSDCNPSSALGVLGVMLGYDRIPEVWTRGLETLADQPFDFTEYSFESIVESTLRRALTLIRKSGGSRDGDQVRVRIQPPSAASVEPWDDFGFPLERVTWRDPRWEWSGTWQPVDFEDPGGIDFVMSEEKGARASIRFRGTGVILVGPLLPSGGRAEIYLDSARVASVDVYPDDTVPRRRESIWHTFGLQEQEHRLELVVLGEPYGNSGGAQIGIRDLVVFGPERSGNGEP